MRSDRDVIGFIHDQPRMMQFLQAVASLGLPDCWIGAGFVRNAVWDAVHGRAYGDSSRDDVDVVYFDPLDTSPDRDLRTAERLARLHPEVPWDVKNQARMYLRNGDPPYKDTADALRYWPETATAVAVRLQGGHIELAAPYGTADLLAMVIRPTPVFAKKAELFSQRLAQKNWTARWPMVRITSA
jgi:hypothetical protein